MRQQYNKAPGLGRGGGAGGGGGGGASSYESTTPARPAATSYAARGWAVLPCRPRGKEPLTPHGFLDASSDPEIIAEWWRRWPEANIGVATGSASGVVVLDVDPRSGGDEALRDLVACHGPLPETPTVLTGGGGCHFYFAIPEGVTIRSRRLAPGLDLKGEAGYVVAPPSVHPSGQRYMWELGRSPDDLPLAPLPVWLLEEGDGGRREYEWDGEPIPEGRRHTHLVSLAGKLRASGLGVEAIEAALLLENLRRCQPPLPEREVRAIARSMSSYPPYLNLPGNGHAADRADSPPLEALAATAPVIIVIPGAYDLAQVVDRAWGALLAANRPPRLFRQGDALVEMEGGDVRVVGVARLRELLARAASWQRPSPHGFLPVPPPEAVAQAMLERPHQGLPVLRGVVRVPVVTEGGIIDTPGYDAATGLYYTPGPGLEEMPPVPEEPTEEDVAEAKRLLMEELMPDFPYDGQASRAGAVAMLLTPFLQQLIDGPTPLFLVDKPSPGSGATLLATAIALVTTGQEPTYLPPRESEEEWRKAITSVLMQGAGVVLIDNARALSSATLSSAITATVWSDRLLGRNVIVTVPNLGVWATSGNNLALSLELARRCVRVRLEPPTERPWMRTGFRHPHLLRWVRENRGRLVWACLVLARHWLARGRPSPSCPRPGMFEGWGEVVGGVLEAAGIQGFLENVLEVYEEAEASPLLERARGLVRMWWVRFGEQEVTAGQLLEAAQQEGLEEEPAGKREKDRQARRLGTMLRQLRGRVFDLEATTVRVTKAGVDARTKQGRWRLVRLNGPQGGAEHAECAECAECPKADAGLPAPAADGPEHIPHIPQPPPGLRLKEPPHPPQPCPRCRPAGLPGYYVCERGQEVTLLRVGIERERHVLRSRQAICFNFGLLRAIEPDFLVVSFTDGSWGWVTLATAKKLGHEGEFGAERQLAVPLGAFNWEAAQGWLPDKEEEVKADD